MSYVSTKEVLLVEYREINPFSWENDSGGYLTNPAVAGKKAIVNHVFDKHVK